MPGRTLIDGVGYTVNGGKDLIGGVTYTRSGGKTLVDGVGYNISFWTTKHVLLDNSTLSSVSSTPTSFTVTVPSSIRSKVVGFYIVTTFEPTGSAWEIHASCAFLRDGYLCSVKGAWSKHYAEFTSYQDGVLTCQVVSSRSNTGPVAYYLYCILANGTPSWTDDQYHAKNKTIYPLPLHTIAAIQLRGNNSSPTITTSADYAAFEDLHGYAAEATKQGLSGNTPWSPTDNLPRDGYGVGIHLMDDAFGYGGSGFNSIQIFSL